jgi:hypothetical protein
VGLEEFCENCWLSSSLRPISRRIFSR